MGRIEPLRLQARQQRMPRNLRIQPWAALIITSSGVIRTGNICPRYRHREPSTASPPDDKPLDRDRAIHDLCGLVMRGGKRDQIGLLQRVPFQRRLFGLAVISTSATSAEPHDAAPTAVEMRP